MTRILRTIRTRLDDQDGNALVMMPAAVLIALGLVALAVNAAVLWRAELEAQSVASSLANDAASAVDVGTFYTGTDPRPADALVADLVATRTGVSASNGLNLSCGGATSPTTPPQVVVTCTYTASRVIRPPGAGPTVTRTVVGRADLRQG